jgi:membrane-associated phospholipid phosphatase
LLPQVTLWQFLAAKFDNMNSAVLSLGVPTVGFEATGLRVAPTRLAGPLLVSLGLCAAVLVALLAATGMRLGPEFAKFSLLAVLMGCLAGFCHYRRYDWRITDSAMVVAFAIASLMLCGLVSSVALRLGMHVADPALARADALIGFDTRKMVQFVATQPWLSGVLYYAYGSSALLCLAAFGWSMLLRDRIHMWRIVVTIGVAMQITALVSILFPARGAALHLGLDALQGHGLPGGAGTYSEDAFAYFYSGADTLVALERMNGIVCFPSYHTVMALVFAQGFAASILRWPAILWSALIIVSTVPMGGHYVVDLAGGLLVWIAAFLLAQWAGRAPAACASAEQPVGCDQ